MRAFASRPAAAKRSGVRVLFDAAARRPDAIRLEVGEPSFTTPQHIIDAAAEAAAHGYTRYGPNGGLTSLRELLAEKIARVDGYSPSPQQVVVTPGGMNALYSVYLALLEPGDQVLLPTPGFPNMDEMVRLLGGDPVFYELRAEDGFLPDVDRLGGLVSDRTKVLFVNSPSNPTGAVFPAEVMHDLAGFAARHDLWLLSDEVYDELVLDDDASHTAAATCDDDGRVISVYSFSKVYAMTGWRVGYCVAPEPLAALLCKLQEPQVSCPSTISQKAAEAALTGPRAPIEAMRAAYQLRRDRAWEVMRDVGLHGHRSRGTIYMLVDIAAAGRPSMDFCLALLDSAGVSVSPGEVFGPAAERFVRISLAAEVDLIEEGLRRISAALASGLAAVGT